MMVIEVPTEFDALQLLETYAQYAKGMDVLVCSAAFRMAKNVAKNLFWKYPDSERRLEVDRVTLQTNGNKFRFMGVGNGEKVRGMRVPITVLVTEGMTREAIEMVAYGAALAEVS